MERSPRGNKISSILKISFFAVLALLVVLNFFIVPHSPHFGLDKYLGFWAIFGCLMAIVLARLAKGAAHTILGRDDDFYSKKHETGTPS